MNALPWPERINMLSINPDAATRDDVAKLASDLTHANLRVSAVRAWYERIGKGLEELSRPDLRRLLLDAVRTLEASVKESGVDVAKRLFDEITPEERAYLASRWCRSCWNAGPGCRCGNDE